MPLGERGVELRMSPGTASKAAQEATIHVGKSVRPMSDVGRTRVKLKSIIDTAPMMQASHVTVQVNAMIRVAYE